MKEKEQEKRQDDTIYPPVFNLYKRVRFEHNGFQPKFTLRTSRRNPQWENLVQWYIKNLDYRAVVRHGRSPVDPARAVMTIRDSAGAPMSQEYQTFAVRMEYRPNPCVRNSEVRRFRLLSSKGTFGFNMQLEYDRCHTSFRWRRCSPWEIHRLTGIWRCPAWKLVREPMTGDFEVGRVADVVAVGDFRRAQSKRGSFRFLWESKSGAFDEPWATPAVLSWLAMFTWWRGMAGWMF